MPIIIISADAYQTGRDIAAKTAQAMAYDHVDREILPAVGARYGVPAEKLVKALQISPSFFGLSARQRDRYLACIQAATLARLTDGRVVCHGLAAHLYVLGISHVLKVRLLADTALPGRDPAAAGGALSSEKAQKMLRRHTDQCRRWSLAAFHLDETDPANYDMVIRLNQIDVDQAVKAIVGMAGYRRFKPMTYSIKCLRDKALASKVRALLLERFPDVKVTADGHTVVVETQAVKREQRKRSTAIEKLAGSIEGVEQVEVHVAADIFRQAAESLR